MEWLRRGDRGGQWHLTGNSGFGYSVCIQELQEATSVHEDAEELLGIGPFPFLVVILVRIRVGLRRTVPSYGVKKLK